jgi:hypothetical protein
MKARKWVPLRELMRGSPRFWLQGLLIGALLATQTGVVVAQIPNPLDTGGTLQPSPVPTVDEAVQDAIDTVTDTINTAEETVNTVEDTGGQATEPVQAPKDTVGKVKDAAAGSTSGTTNTVDGVTGTVSQQKEAGGGTTGTSPAGTTGTGGPSERAYTAAMAGSLQNWVRARGLFNSAALLAGAQPSLAILVDAVNDADGDGIFSDAESAPEPRTDVTFKALITNIGSTGFEIGGVSHSYAAANGPAQGKVCAELMGIMLAPGESLACSFPVPDYSPARGESLVNTVMAAGFEVGKGARRGASDSDTTTVETIVTGDEVLAVAIKRNLAFTGTDAARLLALALVLLASGGGLISMARARSRRRITPLPSDSSAELLGWWSAGPERTRPRERAHTK